MSKSIEQSKPTTELPNDTYPSLQRAYNFFNERLFEGKLKPCLITLRAEGRSLGYFCAERFARSAPSTGGDSKPVLIDEIAMNPGWFTSRELNETLSTLVHEQAHLWQFHFGKKPSRAYHDREWGRKMKEIGLYPSNTGKPGGKETGQKMSHYIMQGGAFETFCAEYLRENSVVLYQDQAMVRRASLAGLLGLGGGENGGLVDGEGDGEGAEPEKSKGRAKFCCSECKLNAWAKPSAVLVCGECNVTLERADG